MSSAHLDPSEAAPSRGPFASSIGWMIFASRWLQAPLYLGQTLAHDGPEIAGEEGHPCFGGELGGVVRGALWCVVVGGSFGSGHQASSTCGCAAGHSERS